MKSKMYRLKKGSLMVEYATTMYILLFILAFPLINLSVMGFRSFFLWFAANQAVVAASKARTYLQPTEIPPDIIYPSACQAAAKKANEVRSMFSGIHWIESDNNPDVQIIREPINPGSKNAKPEAVFTRNCGAPLANNDDLDQSSYIYTCRVVIKGQVDPLIIIPMFDVPGLSKPIDLTVSSQAQYENVPGLRM
jgi:hypothetical protein